MKSLFAPRKITSIALLAALIAVVFSLSACNTVEGAGKDLERAGEAVQEAVK